MREELGPAVRSWVESVAGGSLVAAERRFAGGSRDLWFIDVERGDRRVSLVVRCETGSGSFAGTDLSLRREASAYRALAGTEVPIAGLIGVSPGGDALLLERLAGTSRVDDLDEQEAVQVLVSFVDALAALHAVDPAQLDLPGFAVPASPADHALSDLDLWESLAAGHLADLDPMLAYAFEWLRRHPPASVQRTVLVQGDTGPGNFVFHEGAVTGLVDWELCHIGDPMDDIAWVDMRTAAVGGPLGDVGIRDRLYEAASGLTIDRDSVRYYAAFVDLRCAVTTGMAIARAVVPWVSVPTAPRTTASCAGSAGPSPTPSGSSRRSSSGPRSGRHVPPRSTTTPSKASAPRCSQPWRTEAPSSEVGPRCCSSSTLASSSRSGRSWWPRRLLTGGRRWAETYRTTSCETWPHAPEPPGTGPCSTSCSGALNASWPAGRRLRPVDGGRRTQSPVPVDAGRSPSLDGATP
jgi:aminoglycoside phosphotransferase (APT) family kinase protein